MDTVVQQPGKLVRRGTTGYQPPPLPWPLEPASLAELARMAPGIFDVRDIRPQSRRGWPAGSRRGCATYRCSGIGAPVIAALRFG